MCSASYLKGVTDQVAFSLEFIDHYISVIWHLSTCIVLLNKVIKINLGLKQALHVFFNRDRHTYIGFGFLFSKIGVYFKVDSFKKTEHNTMQASEQAAKQR